MSWTKQGLVFCAAGNFGWMKSHAQVPTILVLKDRLRVYFATRSTQIESKISYVDLDISNPKKILYLHEGEVIKKGSPGTFDEHGVMPSSIVRVNADIYLYYSGWSRRTSVPYSNFTGLAISKDDGRTFEKIGAGPILTAKVNEPFSATSPWVHHDQNGFHMFYCSGTGWIKIKGKYEHTYDIKYAYSSDGIHYEQTGKTIISSNSSEEALTRPSIYKKGGVYYMMFCYRGSRSFRSGPDSYRISHATSSDLINWSRSERISLDVSDTGWDCEMVAYPAVVTLKNKTYMFYNGNGFGASGFGYAELQEP
ncbi:hypothetical protein N9M46_01080 [Gammaproteobacteria bacterium]|nr:hypothetical protein [Gammaproteobacteria bacterium]